MQMANAPTSAVSTDQNVPAFHGSAGDPGIGILGETAGGGIGVHGVAASVGHGVRGTSTGGRGVVGMSQTFFGVSGQSQCGVGVSGESASNFGVFGKCTGGNSGVHGISDTGHGVHGESRTNHAVHGVSSQGRGVVGKSQVFVGVTGESTSHDGVFGLSATGVGVHGKGGQLAGLFEGDVAVTRTLRVDADIEVKGNIRLANADCAEDFDIAGSDAVEPGTVMVLGSDGALCESRQPYDKRVAGVISGAGNYKPGIVLDQQQSSGNRQPLALLGKVYCKVDAGRQPVAVGDLLTTSPTPGHAMATNDPIRSFGAIIGKALRPLASGQGLIPILVTLQ
jgi:hypothetical protein